MSCYARRVLVSVEDCMLRHFLDRQMEKVKNHPKLRHLLPLFSAIDTFLYEAPMRTRTGPHIRDSVDLKRWMSLVVFAMTPAILMAIWNSGLQSLVYGSSSSALMNQYLAASGSISTYIDFALQDNRWIEILKLGLMSFIPVVLVSYTVGGLVEVFFACIRRHEVAEGFLVTGMLFPLVLPPTIPLWMVAVGVAAGVTLSKELFGGTGMNIFNPALICRALLFFGYPSRMSGDIWVGSNTQDINASLKQINLQAGLNEFDGFSQTSPLSIMNISSDIARVHVDAIASNTIGQNVETYGLIASQFEKWKVMAGESLEWTHLSINQLKAFVTGPFEQGGLGLGAEHFKAAYDFAGLKYGLSHFTDGTLFFGNHVGCFGETSTLACLIGALILVITRIGSWRTMLGVLLGAVVTAQLFNTGAHLFGIDSGAWNPAKYTLPAYKHLIMGGLAFGLVFMATDPVSSPSLSWSRWIYGFLIGFLTVVIRVINPAYPEGVMLAILFGNVFAPLIDHYTLKLYRRPYRVNA